VDQQELGQEYKVSAGNGQEREDVSVKWDRLVMRSEGSGA